MREIVYFRKLQGKCLAYRKATSMSSDELPVLENAF